jgi:hypothetical protein
MKRLLLPLALGVALGANAQAWSEDFNSGIPASWTVLNQDNLTPNSGLNNVVSGLATQLSTSGWVAVNNGTGNKSLITTSYFSSPGKADRWLISPSFQVTSTNMYILWQDAGLDVNFRDSIQVLVSPTAGTTPASFTATLYNDKSGNGGFASKGVSLGAYNGQVIRVAFRDNSTDQYVMLLDNVSAGVLPANELQLTAISPDANSPLTYKTVGGTYQISGMVKNNGSQTVTSYTVKYQVGSSAPVSQTVSANIPLLNFGTFTINTPVSVPAMGNTPVKVWVELSGDNTHSNDTLSTQAYGVSFMPVKRLAFEEATGTWCGWCPRGSVFMDSMYKVNPNQTTLIAVHNQDPMMVTAYDALITSTAGFTGFPGVVLDRREVIDPSDMFDYYNAEKNYFGFADVNFTHPVISGTTLTTTVTVKPAIDLSGDYRLAMVVSEDHVHGSGSSWDQHNYYSSTNQDIPLSGAGHNWQASPDPIPASQMYYEFVARAAVPSPAGAPGSLPASMTTGTNYTYNFSTALDPSWDVNKLRVAVLLIRNSDGQVLNSNSTVWPTSIKNIASVDQVSLYPNPAKENVNISFNLTEKSNVQVQILDATGRLVKDVANQTMGAGTQTLNVSTADLAAGIYNVKFQTESGSHIERLTVIK